MGACVLVLFHLGNNSITCVAFNSTVANSQERTTVGGRRSEVGGKGVGDCREQMKEGLMSDGDS